MIQLDAYSFLCYGYIMENIKVSVIIPVYNVEKYIEECIESVLSQTLDGVEIVLVDDGSTDCSGGICKKYSEQYPETVKYIRKVNEGVSIARNTGLVAASGEFVHFMDSDDTVDETFYQKCYEIAKTENSNVVVIDKYFDKANLKDMYSNTAWALFIRKSVLDKHPNVRFPEGVQPAEDGIFVHKLTSVLDGDGLSLNTESLYHYRVHAAGDHIRVKKNNEKLFIQIQKWLDVLAKFYDETGVNKKRAFHVAKFLNREPLGRLLATKFSKEQTEILTDKIIEFYNNYVKSNLTAEKPIPLRLLVLVKTGNVPLARLTSLFIRFVCNLIPMKKVRKIIRWHLL